MARWVGRVDGVCGQRLGAGAAGAGEFGPRQRVTGGVLRDNRRIAADDRHRRPPTPRQRGLGDRHPDGHQAHRRRPLVDDRVGHARAAAAEAPGRDQRIGRGNRRAAAGAGGGLLCGSDGYVRTSRWLPRSGPGAVRRGSARRPGRGGCPASGWECSRVSETTAAAAEPHTTSAASAIASPPGRCRRGRLFRGRKRRPGVRRPGVVLEPVERVHGRRSNGRAVAAAAPNASAAPSPAGAAELRRSRVVPPAAGPRPRVRSGETQVAPGAILDPPATQALEQLVPCDAQQPRGSRRAARL